MNLCFPTFALEEVLARLNRQQVTTSATKQSPHRIKENMETMRQQMSTTHLPIVAELGKAAITVKELLELQLGDVIKLSKRINQELELVIGGKRKLAARPGSVDGKKAVRVTRKLTDDDLYDEDLSAREKELRDIYEKAGYPCHSVSALRGTNTGSLKHLLQGKINLFSGYSGAGKSALIMAIEPSLQLKTAALSEMHLTGRHTTTFTEMYELSDGGFIIDTPGIKEFGLIDFEKQEIPRCFPEMDRLLDQCQYNNCSHTHEPGCAVKEALKTGEVSNLRYNSYLSILNDE